MVLVVWSLLNEIASSCLLTIMGVIDILGWLKKVALGWFLIVGWDCFASCLATVPCSQWRVSYWSIAWKV